MGNFTASVAAATAVVGFDLFAGEVWARTPNNRILQGTALCGSAVVGDSEVEFYIDEVRVSQMFNIALLFPDNDQLLPLENLFIPAGSQLRAIVRDAPATSVLNAMVAVRDV